MSIPASALSVPAHSAAARRPARRRVLLSAVLVGTVLAIVGFWRSYFGPLLAGTVHASLLIHVHAAVMVAWLALVIAQVWFAASGRIRLHMRLGPWVMGFAVVVLIVGMMAISNGFATRLGAGDVFRAQRWLFGTLRDVAFVIPFFVAGWIYRQRPEVHKRVMLVATTLLLAPAVGRMSFLSFLGFPLALWKFMLIWPLPVYLAMAHDFRTKRLIHPVYVIGIMTMLTMRLILPLNTSPTWHAIAAHITAFYQAEGIGR